MKRSAELRPLSDDHHRALVLAKRAKETAGQAEETIRDLWQEIQAEYTAHLAPHFAVEEKYLLPAVRQAGGPALADRTADEHRALRQLIRDGPFDGQTLANFGTLLFDHVRFEERTLFPFAEAHLSESDLRTIQTVMAAS